MVILRRVGGGNAASRGGELAARDRAAEQAFKLLVQTLVACGQLHFRLVFHRLMHCDHRGDIFPARGGFDLNAAIHGIFLIRSIHFHIMGYGMRVLYQSCFDLEILPVEHLACCQIARRGFAQQVVHLGRGDAACRA